MAIGKSMIAEGEGRGDQIRLLPEYNSIFYRSNTYPTSTVMLAG
jgi:hypothetical protein